MRIVHVVEDFSAENAGVTSAIQQLTRIRGADGALSHEVVSAGVASAETDASVKVFLGRASGVGRAWGWTRDLGETLARRIERADVVHVHGVWAYPQLAGARIAAQRGTPMVFSPHNMIGGWLWKNTPPLKILKKRAYLELVCGRYLRKAKVIHALSSVERASLMPFMPGERILVVPNCIDVGDVARRFAGAGVAEDRFNVFLGRLHRVKGLHLVLQAMATLPASRRVPLHVIGPEEDAGYASELHEFVGAAGLAPWVHFLGPMFGSEKYRVLGKAWSLIAPSYSEGVSMSALEAMAGGVPVVTTAAAGIDDLPVGGGLEVAPGAPQIAAALLELESWGLSERVGRGQAARSFVASRFDTNVVGLRFEREVYRPLCQSCAAQSEEEE